ncbi:MAG: asparagine synthetase B [Planctomycetes bacterium]|nr:asparagine synthetase B [Planctomycetota bacterium]
MCGILGARDDWLRGRGFDPETAMRRAVERLRWRGPDGVAVVRIAGWWIGCARLAITQPRSSQPVVRRGARSAGVLNGAITNARELWRELLPGAERRRAPPNDAWLPLLAIEHDRAALLASLRGHHAYAVVDAANRLVLGQDRFGEKPLLCLHGRNGDRRRLFAFASTPGALRELGMPPLGRPRRLGEWFHRGFARHVPHRFDAKLCLDELPARGVPFVVVDDGATWCEPLLRAPAARRAAPTNVRDELIASVSRCADTTVATGILLSGGVDSSCLAAALAAAGRRAPAFQFRADGEPEAERHVARAVATRCRLPFQSVDGGPEVLDALRRLTECAGLPLGDPSVLAVHAVARAAAATGIRVLLGGEGADELFLGYRRYRAIAHLPRLRWLADATKGWKNGYVARWLRAAASEDPAAALLAVVPPAFGAEVLAPALTRGSSRRDRGPRAADPVLAARDADLRGYLCRDLLPKVDVACMTAGVEARAPFLEGEFAPFGATREALGKAPLRGAFAIDLPSLVFRRPKQGFSLPLDRWFRGPLPALDLLAETRSRQRPHLRPGGLAAAVDRHRRGARLGHALYLLLAFETWLRVEEGEDSRQGRSDRTRRA